MNRTAQMTGNGSKGLNPLLMTARKNGARAEASGNEPLEWIKVRELASRNISKFMSLLMQVSSTYNTNIAHRIRALSRRVELLVELFYAKPLPRHVHKLRRRARKCRHVLGKLSDYDALLAIAGRSLDEAPPAQKAAWKSMQEYLLAERNKKAPSILRAVSELDFASPAAKIKCDIDADHASWRGVSNGRAKKANDLAEERIRHMLGHLWNHFDSALAEAHQDPCEQSIHNVRIAVKQVRNVVAVMNKLKIAGSSSHLAWLRVLQRAIGAWHDLEVLEHTMTGLLLRKKFLREHLELAVEIEQLLLQNRAVKKSSEENFGRMTRHSREYEEMKLWVANLTSSQKSSVPIPTDNQKKAAAAESRPRAV